MANVPSPGNRSYSEPHPRAEADGMPVPDEAGGEQPLGLAAAVASSEVTAADAPASRDTTLVGQIRNLLIDELAEQLGCAREAIDCNTPLADYGVDSVLAAAAMMSVEEKVNIFIEPRLILEYGTIPAIADHLSHEFPCEFARYFDGGGNGSSTDQHGKHGAQLPPERTAPATTVGAQPVQPAIPAASGSPMLEEIPAHGKYQETAVAERLAWLNARVTQPFSHLTHHRIEPRSVRGNIENFVGVSAIPVGLAGPLLINGEYAQGIFYAPIATVEGTIVSSASRGARVISESGGINVRVLDSQIIRAPVFVFRNVGECLTFQQWVNDRHAEIKAQADRLSSFGSLTRIDPHLNGNAVHLRFSYTSGEAAGQNMCTVMTSKAMDYIKEAFPREAGIPIRFSAIEGNMSGDKKPNALNLYTCRGKRVAADVLLRQQPYERILNCSFAQVGTLMHYGAHATRYANSLGTGINAANIVAGLFASTGQDLGAIYESATTEAFYEFVDGGLYVSYLFPGLVVGTVGGAHGLGTQRECLRILGCDGGAGSAKKLAEIIAAFAVALDISTCTAVANGTFAAAHSAYGRRRAPKRGTATPDPQPPTQGRLKSEGGWS